jgi:hypothetical protein
VPVVRRGVAPYPATDRGGRAIQHQRNKSTPGC